MDGLQNTHGGYKDIMDEQSKSALRHLGRDCQRAAEGCDTSRQEILSSLRAAFQRFFGTSVLGLIPTNSY